MADSFKGICKIKKKQHLGPYVFSTEISFILTDHELFTDQTLKNFDSSLSISLHLQYYTEFLNENYMHNVLEGVKMFLYNKCFFP